MTLKQAILNLSKSNIDGINDWYNWRSINENLLPANIKLPIGNQFKKNIALKNELNQLWKETQDQELIAELIIYYIRTWGGIRGNKKESLDEYTTLSADELILKGKQGIASWSKAICVHDPKRYAIFDARVSISLNCLQIISNTDDKILYPVLASQNKTIAKGNKIIKALAKSDKWNAADENRFYNDYLKLLGHIASQMKTGIASVEMLLFAKAEELIRIALPNEFND